MRRPELDVLETVLYRETGEREAVERFYGDLLGLPAAAGWEDGIAFRIGGGVLLLFDRELLALRPGPIADHGSHGPGHVCLKAGGADDLQRWRELLEAAGVQIVEEPTGAGRARCISRTRPQTSWRSPMAISGRRAERAWGRHEISAMSGRRETVVRKRRIATVSNHGCRWVVRSRSFATPSTAWGRYGTLARHP